MGYALFTARKLSVTARLNLCNAQMMSNTERANALTSTIFAKQSASALDKAQASQKAYAEYSAAISKENVTQDEKTKAESELSKALADVDIKSAMTNAEIQGLNMQQTVLDQQKKMLETQLNAYTNELENVSKAEESAIKSSTPSYK